MERSRLTDRYRYTAMLLCLASLAPALGCSAAVLAMYMVKGNNVPGEYDGLKDKTVAVVCRPTASLQYTNASVSKQLARLVARELERNIRKIQVIDPSEVDQWTDENSWDEYLQVGQALKADVVIGIDLEQFSLYQGQTLYQGRANLVVKVLDVDQGGDVLFEKTFPQSVYPPNTGIATSDRPEAEFRAEYLRRLADQVGWLFYPHDSRADFAVDSLAL